MRLGAATLKAPNERGGAAGGGLVWGLAFFEVQQKPSQTEAPQVVVRGFAKNTPIVCLNSCLDLVERYLAKGNLKIVKHFVLTFCKNISLNIGYV